MLANDPRASMIEIAAAAHVARSTLYRHFPNRTRARRGPATERRRRGARAKRAAPTSYRAPGQLGRDKPLALEVTNVLDTVPPHLVPDQLVAEARRAAGGAVALYVVDIDGSQLIRLAGSEDFPAELDGAHALGPEIAPEELPRLQAHLRIRFPHCVVEPLWLRGRVLGILLCIGSPIAPLADIAKTGGGRARARQRLHRRDRDGPPPQTDHRRSRDPTEPPSPENHPHRRRAARGRPAPDLRGRRRLVRLRRERDGAWLAIADSSGKGPTAAGLGAAALGSLRAARRAGKQLEDTLRAMDETVRHLGNPRFHVTTLVARWYAATSTLVWVNCSYPPAYMIDTEGHFRELGGHEHLPLGAGNSDRAFTSSRRRARARRAPAPRQRRRPRPTHRRRRHVRAGRDQARRLEPPDPHGGNHRDGDPAGRQRKLARAARGRRHRRRPAGDLT